MDEGLIGGEGFSVDASVVEADASKQKHHEDDDDWGTGSRAINEYLDSLTEDGSSKQKPKTMIERVKDRFGIEVKKLIGDAAYGTAEFLNWMVNEAKIEPHVPVWDRGDEIENRFGRSDSAFDEENDLYTCPAGKELRRCTCR